MRQKISILFLLFFGISCSNTGKNTTAKETPNLSSGDSLKRTESEGDSTINVHSLVFFRKSKVLEGIIGSAFSKSFPCKKGYIALVEKYLSEEYSLFDSQVKYYYCQDDITGLFDDSAFVNDFYKAVTGGSDEFYVMEQLRFDSIYKTTLSDYGDCIIASFKYLSPSSANQDRPLLIFNLNRKEAILFSFSGSAIDKDGLELEFKIRNDKHVFYFARYNKEAELFVPTCYK